MKAGYQLEDVFVATFKPKSLGFYLYVKFLGDNIILTGSPKFNLVPIINDRVFQVEPNPFRLYRRRWFILHVECRRWHDKTALTVKL